MKKAIPIIAIICMAISFVPICSDNVAADTDVGLWINGEAVTQNVTKDTWSYDLDSNTLTLNGATLNTSFRYDDNYERFGGAWEYISSPIYDGRPDSTLKIIAYGENQVLPYMAEDFTMECGIFSMGAVEISGTGSILFHSLNDSNTYYSGFVVNKKLMIDGPTVTVENTGWGCDLEIRNLETADTSANFTMNRGVLNLSSAGNMIVYGSIFVKGGTINSVDNDGLNFMAMNLGLQDSYFDMTGGLVTFPEVTAGNTLIRAYRGVDSPTQCVVDIHGATLTNAEPHNGSSYDDIKATASGSASVGTAPKEFVITLDANEGKSAVPSVLTGDDGKLLAIPEATKDGYNLDGWFTAKDGGDRITTDTVFTENTTLYAHWSEKKADNNLVLFIGIGAGVAVVVAVGAMLFIRKR